MKTIDLARFNKSRESTIEAGGHTFIIRRPSVLEVHRAVSNGGSISIDFAADQVSLVALLKTSHKLCHMWPPIGHQGVVGRGAGSVCPRPDDSPCVATGDDETEPCLMDEDSSPPPVFIQNAMGRSQLPSSSRPRQTARSYTSHVGEGTRDPAPLQAALLDTRRHLFFPRG